MVGYVRKPFPGNRTHGLSVIPRLREFFFFLSEYCLFKYSILILNSRAQSLSASPCKEKSSFLFKDWMYTCM